ncbi:MAG: MarR family winged helix-turn-helix transcriptional regulator [Actinomycetes bacterium]
MPSNGDRTEMDAATDALLIASRALVAVAARSLAGIDDITLPQYRALVVLTRRSLVTIGDLAEALDVHSSTATRLCDRLERKRLLRRRFGASSDRRVTSVVLTAKGRRLVEHVTDRRRRDIAAIVSQMPRDELDHAVRGLRSFAAAADEPPMVDRFGWTQPLEDQARSASPSN